MEDQRLPLVITEVYENQQRSCFCKNTIMIGAILNRILIAVIGIGLGVVTFIPNAMMCDSGTTVAAFAAYTGMLASLSFVIGGIVGAIYQTWFALLPGLILQVAAFTVPSLPFLQKLHQQQLSEMTAKHAPQFEATRAARNITLSSNNIQT